MDDLKTRLLEEIDGRLFYDDQLSMCWSCGDPGKWGAQVLQALRREVERHSPSMEFQKPLCLNCMDPWPCPTITDTARELEVE